MRLRHALAAIRQIQIRREATRTSGHVNGDGIVQAAGVQVILEGIGFREIATGAVVENEPLPLPALIGMGTVKVGVVAE